MLLYVTTDCNSISRAAASSMVVQFVVDAIIVAYSLYGSDREVRIWAKRLLQAPQQSAWRHKEFGTSRSAYTRYIET